MNKIFNKVAVAFVGIAMAIGVGVAVGSNNDVAPAYADSATYTLNGNWTSSSGDWTKVAGSNLNSTLASGKYGLNSGSSTAVSPVSYENISQIVFTGSKSSSGSGTVEFLYSATANGTYTSLTSKAVANSVTWTVSPAVSGYLKCVFTRTAGNVYIASISVTYTPSSGGGEQTNDIIIDASNYSTYTSSGCTSVGVSGSNAFSANDAIIMDANNAGYIYNTVAFERDIAEFYIFANGSASTSAEVDVYFSASSSNPSTNNAHQALSTKDEVYEITVSSGARYFKVVSSNSSKKAQIQIKIVLAEADQAGIAVEWADGKGTYYNGAAAGSKITSSDVVVSAIDENGSSIGAAITNGVGFKLNIYEGETKLVTLDATSSVQTSGSIFNGKDPAHTYTLTAEMVNEDDAENPWVSDPLSITIGNNIIKSIIATSAEVPEYEEYVAYVDTFTAWTGTFNIQLMDNGTRSNRTTTVKYYDSTDAEVQISSYVTDGVFTVDDDNVVLTVRIFDSAYVGKNGNEYYPNKTYNIYVYAILDFSVEDPSGANAEYPTGASVSLNPVIHIGYLDKDTTECEVENPSASMLNFYYSSDGENYSAYTGTMPSTPDVYTIKAVLGANPSFVDTYDISVVDSTLTVVTSKNTAYKFGESFDKSVLTVKLDDTTIAATNYTVLDGESEVTVIKFIGNKTLTIRYLGYEAELEVSATNVGSSESNIHEDVPGEWAAGDQSSIEYDSASDTCTASKKLLDSDGLSYSGLQSNATYNVLLNGSSVIYKAQCFNKHIYALSLSIDIATNDSSSSFTFTLAGMSGNDVSGTRVASSASTSAPTGGKSKAANVSVNISGIPYNEAIDGWKITVAKSGSGNNAQFYNLTIGYTPYEQGAPTIYNATPTEQALVFSQFFLENTSEYCTSALSSEIKTLLANEYNGMVDDAKDVFAGAAIVRGKNVSYENDISEALTRYVNMYEEKGTGDFLSLGESVLQNAFSDGSVSTTSNSGNTTTIIVIISLLSVASLGGYLLLRRKEN